MSIFADRPDLLKNFRDGDEATLIWLRATSVIHLERRLAAGFRAQIGEVNLFVRGDWTREALDAYVEEAFQRAFKCEMRSAYRVEQPFGEYLFSVARDVIIRDLTDTGIRNSSAKITFEPTVHEVNGPPPSNEFGRRRREVQTQTDRWLVAKPRTAGHIATVADLLGIPMVTAIAVLLGSAYPIFAAVW